MNAPAPVILSQLERDLSSALDTLVCESSNSVHRLDIRDTGLSTAIANAQAQLGVVYAIENGITLEQAEREARDGR